MRRRDGSEIIDTAVCMPPPPWRQMPAGVAKKTLNVFHLDGAVARFDQPVHPLHPRGRVRQASFEILRSRVPLRDKVVGMGQISDRGGLQDPP
jgi:hypothetical protein